MQIVILEDSNNKNELVLSWSYLLLLHSGGRIPLPNSNEFASKCSCGVRPLVLPPTPWNFDFRKTRFPCFKEVPYSRFAVLLLLQNLQCLVDEKKLFQTSFLCPFLPASWYFFHFILIISWSVTHIWWEWYQKVDQKVLKYCQYLSGRSWLNLMIFLINLRPSSIFDMIWWRKSCHSFENVFG